MRDFRDILSDFASGLRDVCVILQAAWGTFGKDLAGENLGFRLFDESLIFGELHGFNRRGETIIIIGFDSWVADFVGGTNDFFDIIGDFVNM